MATPMTETTHPATVTAIGVEHTLELFDAGHMSIGYRYPRSLAFLATALSSA